MGELIELPASQLLAEFGAGKPTPGSGCAAALMGLLAANMAITVAKLTIERSSDRTRQREAEFVRDVLQAEVVPELNELFQRDATVFKKVIELRKLRNAAETPSQKGRFSSLASIELKSATDVLFGIAECVSKVLERGVWLYRQGFRGARGDVGAALSAAIGSITTCIFIIDLNIKSSNAGWTREAHKRCDGLRAKLAENQAMVSELLAESGADAARSVLPAPIEGQGILIGPQEDIAR